MDRTQAIAVGGNHVTILGDSMLHDELGKLLGVVTSQSTSRPAVSLSVRDGVVEASDYVNVSVRFTYTDPIIDGSIHIEPRHGFALRRAPVIQAPVEMPITRSMCLEVALKAPEVPSIHRVSWYEKGSALAPDDLIVQSPSPLSEQDFKEFEAMAATT